MDVSEISRRLKPFIQLQPPAVCDRFTKEALQILRRFIVGLDLVSLPVEGFAPVVVGCDMYVKDETVFPQIIIPFLGDVRAEVSVPAIWGFDRISAQHAGYQRVGVRQAIRNKMHRLAGVAGTVGGFFRHGACRSFSRRW